LSNRHEQAHPTPVYMQNLDILGQCFNFPSNSIYFCCYILVYVCFPSHFQHTPLVAILSHRINRNLINSMKTVQKRAGRGWVRLFPFCTDSPFFQPQALTFGTHQSAKLEKNAKKKLYIANNNDRMLITPSHQLY